MRTAKPTTPKARPPVLCTLAAMILGYLRGPGIGSCSSQQLTMTFPSFARLALAHAVDELLDKQLMKQKGVDGKATYTLTEFGRDSRIIVA